MFLYKLILTIIVMMNFRERDDLKTRILDAIHDYLKNKGYDEIKSVRDGMEPPRKIIEQKSNKIFRPDIVAHKDEQRDIFEIELHNKPVREDLLDKYRTFLSSAKKFSGKFYLIVPVEQFEKTLQFINQNNLVNIGIIQVDIKNGR